MHQLKVAIGYIAAVTAAGTVSAAGAGAAAAASERALTDAAVYLL